MAKTTDLHSAQAKATVRAPVPDALKLYIIQQVYLGNLTIDAAIATGHISRSQLYKELKIYRETGQITERKKSTGIKAKAPPEARAYVLALFQHRPSMYLREAVDMLNHHFGILVDKSTISDWLKQDGLSHKKLTKTATQQDEDLRIDYTLHMGQYLPQQLVFADETHFDQRNANRSMGWAETGRRAEVRQDFRRTGGLSVLPAIDHNGILAAWCVDGAVDGDMFTYWVEHFLLPEMNPFPGPRSVLVLDNCNIHKATTTREKVEAKVLLDQDAFWSSFPPYSPDLNPIETAFNSIKRYVQRNALTTRADIIQATYKAVKPEHARAYFRHSGYV